MGYSGRCAFHSAGDIRYTLSISKHSLKRIANGRPPGPVSPVVDKLYKPLFLSELKLSMATHLPGFMAYRVPANHPQRALFAGALLFSSLVHSKKVAWLWWTLGAGVERCFDVALGWSPDPAVLPHQGGHDPRIYSLRGPTEQIPAASIHLQQILGGSAVGGFTIPTPWDQLLAVKVAAPKREHDAALKKAYAEASALSEEQRLQAVRVAVEGVFDSLLLAMPPFIKALHASAGDAS